MRAPPLMLLELSCAARADVAGGACRFQIHFGQFLVDHGFCLFVVHGTSSLLNAEASALLTVPALIAKRCCEQDITSNCMENTSATSSSATSPSYAPTPPERSELLVFQTVRR